MLWVNVIGFANGEFVEEDTLNRPIRQLRERTDYLYGRLQGLLGSSEFQSVRLLDVPLETGTDEEPDVKDVVYLKATTKTYAKAVATILSDSSIFQTAEDSAYGLGILVEKNGTTGTVVVYGKLDLEDTIPWTLTDLLESNEEFRAGPYYLSSFEAGKLTAIPSGPAIYMGYFTDSAASPGTGGFAVINPNYKDVGEAHMHRAFALVSQPAGTQEVTGNTPTSVHIIHGFAPKSAGYAYHGTHTGDYSGVDTVLEDTMANWTLANYIGVLVKNVTKGTQSICTNNDIDEIWTQDNIPWDTGDEYFLGERCRIVVIGDYVGNNSTTYTLTLTDATGVAAVGGGAPFNGPIGFEEAYLKWVSSDPEEGEGLERIISYEVPVPFGNKGMSAIVENVLADESNPLWNWMESANEDLARRQWEITAPDDTAGWRQRRFRQFFQNHQTTDGNFSLILFGGYENDDKKLQEDITVAACKIYSITYSGNPTDGETVTIFGVTYEFDEDGIVADGNQRVAIEYAGAEATYTALRNAMLAYGAENVHPVMDAGNSRILIGVPKPETVASTTGLTNGVIATEASGDDGDLDGITKPNFLVYGEDYDALVVSNGFWETAGYYDPITLTNGLRAMFVPYAADGTAPTSSTVSDGDYWASEVVDEAPGAIFEYAIGMDADLLQIYPPMPLTAAAFTVNGIEMASEGLHDADGAYKVAYGSLYWLVDQFTQVPWPYDWESRAVPGSVDVLSTLYMVHMRMGDTGVVTSLQPAPDSPIRVLRCGTSDPASTGDLMLALDLAFSTEDANLPDYQVFKRIDGTKLLKGPVVSKIIEGSGISISSPPGVPLGCGEVTISNSDAGSATGDFVDIALDNAKQELIGLFPYIRLLGWETGGDNNIPSGLSAKFMLPYTLDGSYQILVYITIFGEEDIAFGLGRKQAGLSFTYSLLRDYDPEDDTYGTLEDNLITPETPLSVEVPFGDANGIDYKGTVMTYKAFDPMVIHNNPNDPFDEPARIVRALGDLFPAPPALKGGEIELNLTNLTARAGSMVAIELHRAGVSNPTTEYTGRLGIMRMRWRLARVAN